MPCSSVRMRARSSECSWTSSRMRKKRTSRRAADERHRAPGREAPPCAGLATRRGRPPRPWRSRPRRVCSPVRRVVDRAAPARLPGNRLPADPVADPRLDVFAGGVPRAGSARFRPTTGRSPRARPVRRQPCISRAPHARLDGVLHTEAEARSRDTLGQFFTEWDVRLTATCAATTGRRRPDHDLRRPAAIRARSSSSIGARSRSSIDRASVESSREL